MTKNRFSRRFLISPPTTTSSGQNWELETKGGEGIQGDTGGQGMKGKGEAGEWDTELSEKMWNCVQRSCFAKAFPSKDQ